MSDSMSVYGDGLFWVSPWIDDLPKLIAEIWTPDVLWAVVLGLPIDLYQHSPELAIQIQKAVDDCLRQLEIPVAECKARSFPDVVWINQSQYGINILYPRAK